MKLLLTSGGLTNKSIIESLRELTEKPFEELSLAFIPTAANFEPDDKGWFIDDLYRCKQLGFKSIDIVDTSALPAEMWQKRLEVANILFFEGGNTYYLMYWIIKSGLRDLLPKYLETKVYVGLSAGSMVANPTLILSTSEKKFVEATGIKMGNEGLGLVDFLIEPHINSPHFPELTFERIEKLSKDIPHPIYALDDQSAVQVIDDTITVISEGEWKKFNE